MAGAQHSCMEGVRDRIHVYVVANVPKRHSKILTGGCCGIERCVGKVHGTCVENQLCEQLHQKLVVAGREGRNLLLLLLLQIRLTTTALCFEQRVGAQPPFMARAYLPSYSPSRQQTKCACAHHHTS